MNNNISVVINYSTNDHKFLYHCINECLKFSKDIVVSYTTRMYDGSREDLDKVDNAIFRYVKNPFVYFHEYNYDHEVTERLGTRYWHNHARYTGWKQTDRENNEYTLFLDVDEIPEGDRFNGWLDRELNTSNFYYTFDAYWYFRDPKYQATTTEQTALLIKNDIISKDLVFNSNERWGMIQHPNGEQHVVGTNGKPMFHHYSWVRNKKEMLRKVRSWGHNQDRNWKTLIEEEFETEFDGTDFVHGYDYKILDKPFKDV